MPEKNRFPAVLQPTAGTLGNRGLRSHTELDGHGAYIPVAQPVPYDLFQITAPVNRQNRKPGDPCHTLARDNAAHAAIAIGTDCYNGAITGDVAATMGTPGSSVNASGPTVMQAVAFKPGQSASAHSIGAQEGVACTLEAGGGGNNKQAVAVAPSLTSTNDPSRSPQSSEVTQQVAAVHASTMTVRRLTPVECERLQGFPDNWTAIPWRGKTADQCPDGPRYKALGNSMAVNCMAWIGERIAAAEEHQ
jgi:DNA (cytosine-5)-methyltransferase 1